MACVIVPAIEAIAVSMILKRMKKGKEAIGSDDSLNWIRKLEWLNKALWGGTFLLVIEHIWHGEITFMPPFLTAMQSPAETEVMLHEMATVGVSMAVFITVVWFIVTAVLDRFQEHESAETISTR